MAQNIIISFDYELFFGDESGTVQKSIIDPTIQLLKALDSVGGKATFFVDYLMLKYMKAENDHTRKDAALVIEQIKDIVRRGHRIELHIHPHWVDAKYIDNKWVFLDFSHYCLISFPQKEITQMFVEGTEMLETIAREVDPNYKIIAYRAGGWAILPFYIMKEGFLKAGIKVDSSVTHGKVIHAYGYDLDFTDVPKEGIYKFSHDVKRMDPKGEFVESQICTFRHGVISTILNLYYHHMHPELFKKLTDGTHNRKDEKRTLSKPLSRWEVLHQVQCFGLGGLPSYLLNYEIRKSKQSHVVIISHPKDIMPITCKNIVGLKKFRFCTYKNITTI